MTLEHTSERAVQQALESYAEREPTPRSGRELILATKPFAIEDRARSWRYMISTFTALLVSITLAALAPWIALRALASLCAGLLTIRGFILYHDHLHGALLKRSRAASWICAIFSVYLLTPMRVWRETHNYHHAHTAKLVGSHIGSFLMVSKQMWSVMGRWDRLKYRLVRHPLMIIFGYLTVFAYGMCVSSFLRDPKRHWTSLLVLMLHIALSCALVIKLGWLTYVFALLIPVMIATGLGSYLFYAQHNFPDAEIKPRRQWSYAHAALSSSSFMEMSPLMHWFTGNIGYHHVHHLNPSVPFYRLPEAMAALPELQDPPRTSLAPREIVRCLRLKLWDSERNELVGYPE